ncbi:MAG: hypothetical protein JXB88_03935 [Spirochaetales bacterium]|nr:hypothetical protein [Spirochaetales bacterium]
MQKAIIIAVLCILSIAGFGQETPTFDDLEESFKNFAEGIASTLPYNALIGLSWSDAHIKNFPHFGIGVTAGFTIMPYVNLKDTLEGLDIDLSAIEDSDIGEFIEDQGMPFPAVSLETRIGGFFLPFDMGFKVGFVPDDFDLSMVMNGFALSYFAIGGDVRFRVVKQWFMVPDLSVGGGLTYQQGSIDIPGILGENIVLEEVGPYNLEMEDPSLNFNWKTFVIDLKVQASWDLFLVTPYIGTGASYGLYAEAGGGIKTQIINSATGEPITQDEIDQIFDWCELMGYDKPDINGTQILVSSETPPAWAYRIFGGVSFNFFILRLDVTMMYNIISGGLGGSLNARVQF